MSTALKAAAFAALTALCFLVLQASFALLQIQQLVSDVQRSTFHVEDSVKALRADLDRNTRTAIDRANARADEAIHTASQGAAAGLQIFDWQLTTANRTAFLEMERLNEAAAEIASVAPPIRRTAEQVAEAAPLFLDCGQNSDCLFNRYTGAARGIERFADAWGKAAPDLARDARQFSSDVSSMTHRYTQPRSTKAKIGDFVLGGAYVAARIR